MNNPLTVLAAPAETYQNILVHPGWRLPFILTTIIFFVLTWLGGCWHDLTEALQWTHLVGPALLSPLIVGIVSLVSAAALYCLVVLFGGTSSRPGVFRAIFSLNTHCGIIFLLGEIINFLLVHADVFGRMRFPLPGRFPLGLDLFLLGSNSANLYIAIALHSTSLFVVWYLVVLSRGLREILGISRMRSTMLTGGLWTLTVASALGLAYALGGATIIRVSV